MVAQAVATTIGILLYKYKFQLKAVIGISSIMSISSRWLACSYDPFPAKHLRLRRGVAILIIIGILLFLNEFKFPPC
jgi:hypothetical protein